MRLTLISPRLAVQRGDFLGSGVPYWPVELATFAELLRQRGHAITALDLFGESPQTFARRSDHNVQGAPLSRWAGDAALLQAEMFFVYGISSMSHAELLEITRELVALRPGVPVVLLENSQAVTAYALDEKRGDFFAAGATALLCGQPHWNIAELLAFLRGDGGAPQPANLIVRDRPNVPVQRFVERLPTLPPPAWDLFPIRNYWTLPYAHGPKSAPYLPMLTSFGCPYRCDFCVLPGTSGARWYGRPAREVVDEMITLRDRFGIRHFHIEDVNPTVKFGRWDDICRLLVERNAGIFFYFVSGTKAETVHIDQVPLYAKAGLRYLSISPESGSPDVLKAIGKPFDHQHGLALIAACHQHGIATQACLLVGHPAETETDHQRSIAYLQAMLRAGLDEVALFGVSPLPGSRLSREGRIEVTDQAALTSFSPTAREDWAVVSRRRRQLLRLFFVEKLKRGPDLWMAGLRAVGGSPRTKMENLPLRVPWVLWHVAKGKAQAALSGGGHG